MTSSIAPTAAHASHGGSSDRLELLLFRLGKTRSSGHNELFGINVFKVREIVVAPHITNIVNAPQHALGLANVRGQLIPVVDLPGMAGCERQTSTNIVLVTEFARSTQAFLVDEVVEIVHLDWKHLLAADNGGSLLLSGIARIDGDAPDSRLAQVLDVEQILRDVLPNDHDGADKNSGLARLQLPPGSSVFVAEDSAVARLMVEESLKAMGIHYAAFKNGRELWDRLNALHRESNAQGQQIGRAHV